MPVVAAAEADPRRAAWLAAGLLVLAAALAYANAWSVPFHFDDTVTLADNPTLRAPLSLRTLLTPAPHTGVGGRPVAHLSFVLNYAGGGLDVRGYHAVNLAIHVLAGLALFGLVRRTLLRPMLAARCGADADWLALAVAGLWLLHPVQTQTVTYLSQRTESLMALFYFLTLYAWSRIAEAPRRGVWLGVSIGSCLAGMATKEVMVTAPLMVLLYDATFMAGSVGAAWRRRWPCCLALASGWVLLFVLLRGLGGRGVGFGHGLEWWRYALTSCRALVTYLSVSVWPHPLVFDYGVDLGRGGAAEVIAAGFVLALIAVTVIALRRNPPLGFLAAWFFLTLAPTTSVVPIPLAPIAENRVYLPLAAVIAALVLAAHGAGWRAGRWAWLGAAVALGILTFARNADYRSPIALWSDTVAKRPESSRAHYNLGSVYREAGRLTEAEREYSTALRLKPDYAVAAAALGGVVARLGRIDEAVARCRAAIEMDPSTPDAHNNLGGALWQKGDLPGAIAAYEVAVRLRPGYTEAYVNLASVLLRVGRLDEALQAGAVALRLNPGLTELRFALAGGLAAAGRLAPAIAAYEDFLRDHPEHAEARYNLATILLQLGRAAEALPHFEAALRQNPNHAPAHSNYANALLRLGRVPEAIAQGEAAVRLQPAFADAHLNLGLALRRGGRGAEAAAHFEAALKLNPNATVARDQLRELQAGK